MGGLALIARQLGHHVSGSDHHVYPPMSIQLEEQGIHLKQGYSAENLKPRPDIVVIGNALSRGNPEVEAVLDFGLPYTSGPQWLSDHVLVNRWVLGVAGTHGKTTTSSMLAWILEHQEGDPGFLIGGIPLNFGISARLGSSPYFVIEADEYDTAFFDKRSKFVHYRPKTAVLNNLEYDHADIFENLGAIQRQFHHLVRTVPSKGLIIMPKADVNLSKVLEMGCWSPLETVGLASATSCDWQAELTQKDGSAFSVISAGRPVGDVRWSLVGRHNVLNALAAIAAAHHAGVSPERAAQALCAFESVKRRMEVIAKIRDITLYDDFAHHPTAIESTLDGLRRRVGTARIIAVLEPRSNTMRLGVHADRMAASLAAADNAILYEPEDLAWDLAATTAPAKTIKVYSSIDEIVRKLAEMARPGDHVVFMSNGGFGGIYNRVKEALQ